jgi:hypothetical protein
MRHHAITAAILSVAIFFYTLGFASISSFVFIIGGAFETWFWIRILIKRSPKAQNGI